MKKFLKDNSKLLIGFIILSVSIPIILLTPSSFGIFSIEVGGILVGYCGAILGGFLTLYGVWWTIEKNKEEKREEISIQYLPILQIESKKISYCYRDEKIPNLNIDENGNVLADDPSLGYQCFEEHGLACELVLKNTGRGEIIEVDVSCFAKDEIISVDYKYNKTDILPQDSIGISFLIDIYDYKKLISIDYEVELKIKIKFFGLMNKEYLNTIPIHILNREPFEWNVPSINEVVTETNDLLYEIGNIKRTKC